ncbi:MAG: acyltransferase [Flavobacteriales bacterium]|nr:acyltransferase [Flavobacteriales bacterium]
MRKIIMENKKRIFGLDLMRATAILMVLSSHVLWIYPHSNSYFSQLFQVFGYLGVELFFVLSGFLIGKILYRLYLENDFTLHHVMTFLKRRWLRTLPNYYLVLMLNIFISFLIGYTISDVWKYFFFLHNFLAPMSSFFPESWSLSVEEFAYLLLPFALYFKTKVVQPKNKANFFLWVILGLIFFFFCAKVYYAFTTTNTTLSEWNTGIKAIVVYRLDAILYGVLAAWVAINHTLFWTKIRFISAVLGCLLFGFLFVGVGFFQLTIETFPNFWNIIYLPLTSIMCLLFLPFLSEWKVNHHAFFFKTITFISKISYSIYLLHYSVLLQLLHFYFPSKDMVGFSLHLYTIGYVCLTFVFSFLLYRFFEKPIMDWRDR